MENSLSQIIHIDRQQKDAVYKQIVYQFINAVKQGQLYIGSQLPGSRIMAQELGIHRRTMVAALEELRAQDWIEVVPNVGTFIKNPEESNTKLSTSTIKKEIEIPLVTNYILDLPNWDLQSSYAYNDGLPDYSLINSQELARFYSGVLNRKKNKNHWNSQHSYDFYYTQIVNYLFTTRNLRIPKKNIICTGSREIILNIVVQMLIKTGDIVLVPELNYFYTNMLFRQSGAMVQTFPLTEYGIDVEYIRTHYQKGDIRLMYLSSKSQYPTGRNLSPENRKAILQLAQDYQIILVEDDNDAELSYEKNLNFSLYKENSKAWIIHLGAIGRFLLPGFQTYYLIGPEHLISEAKKYLNFFGNTDHYKEQAIGEMIFEGDLHRYRRKVLKLYKERRNLFTQLLYETFQDKININIPTGGLALWIEIIPKISLVQWTENCRKLGLFIPNFCLYQNRNTTAMRLGFAHLNEEEMRKSIEILVVALEQLDKMS